MNSSKCDLCKAEKKTHWYYPEKREDLLTNKARYWIADCLTCKVPMVVYREHTTRPPKEMIDKMMEHAHRIGRDVYGDDKYKLRFENRKIKDHYHFHIEPKSSDLALKPSDVDAITPKVFPSGIKTCLYLVPRHADLIYKGKKTLIVKSKKFTSHVNEDMYLIDNKLLYGIISLEEPREISKEEFDKLRDRHRITSEEYREWWRDKDKLYAYEFKFTKLPAPKPIRVPRGAQVFVGYDKIKIITPRSMSLSDLEYYHAYFHSCGDLLSDCCEMHFMIAKEMIDRGLEHLSRTSCDRAVDWLFMDIKTYDPRKVSKKQLGDDFRLALGHYSNMRQGKKYKNWKEDDMVWFIAKKLLPEMIRRGFEFNRPETYTKYAAEGFRKAIEIYGKEIPWKESKELRWKLPEGMRIEDIDIVFVKELTDKELVDVWKFLVERAKETADEPNRIPENIQDSATFVGIEMFKRGLWEKYRGDNILEKAIELEVTEYPTIKGLSEEDDDVPEPEGEITIEDIYNAAPSIIPIRGQPWAAYFTGRRANEGKADKTHDQDLVLRQYPDPRVIKAIKEIKPSWLAKLIHPVFDPNGPSIGMSYPAYHYGLIKVPKDDFVRGFGPYRDLSKNVILRNTKLKVGKPIIGLKPKSGFFKYEFFDPQDMYEKWAKRYLDEGIYVQEKVDGRRLQLHIDKSKDMVKIITEDRQRDRASQFPNVVKEIKEKLKCDECILDGEMVAFKIPSNVKVKSARIKRDRYPLMEREDTAVITSGKVPEGFEDKVVYVFYDIMYLDGETLVDKPYSERFKILDKVVPKDARYLDRVRSIVATTPKEFIDAVRKMRNYNGSEGVVAKAASLLYPIKYKGENRSERMCKLKNLKEIDVMVWDKEEKKRTKTGEPMGNYMYISVYLIPENKVNEFQKDNVVEYRGKHYAIIGKTYATDVKCKRGDIITVMPIRIRKYVNEDGKMKYTWMFPLFKEKRADKTEPDTLTTVERIAKLRTRPAPKDIRSLSMEELESIEPEVIIRLPPCPFSEDKRICPLKQIFIKPRNEELTKVKIEHLKYPIACPLANIYKCVYVKGYYYGMKTYNRKPYPKIVTSDYKVEEIDR